MKVADAVSPEKLRGGFYTPETLVEVCLDRIEELAGGRTDLKVLEPSVGDGAFVRGLSRSRWDGRIGSLTGFELVEEEAAAARGELEASPMGGRIVTRSAVAWAVESEEVFDVAVGNPPYLRFQFLSAADKASAEELSRRLRYPFRGVSNLWIPVLLGALARLRESGAFAFVIPTECFTGSAASVVRRWFLSECADLRFDLFPPGSFPGVLQEVTVASGRRARAETPVTFVEHGVAGDVRTWEHFITDDGSWTRYMLDATALEALTLAEAHADVVPLSQLAKFDVSIVTGANDFFSVSTETVARYDLHAWVSPLLPRIRFADGIEFTSRDLESLDVRGARRWILDFGADRPDPMRHPGALRYLQGGESEGLHERFKCRIRSPWYRVPNFQRGELMLSKRSHHFPRVVLNTASAYTTDTIYRGRMVTSDYSARSLAAGFHNSLTLLSAELFGRSFGGGVLELVPSEVGELRVPRTSSIASHLETLDAIARSGDGDALVDATDRLLIEAGVLEPDVLDQLAHALGVLRGRRFDRSQASAPSLLAA